MRALALAPLVCALACGATDSDDRDAFATALHRRAIVVDLHADTTPYFEEPGWDLDAPHPERHVDLPRLRAGGVDAQFWSIHLPQVEGDGRAIREAIERIDAVHRMVERHADQMVLATSAAEIRQAHAAGKLASLMGVEGGHILEDRLAALRTFHRLGVRYLTLTHSFHTSWADSSGTRERLPPLHGGLTPFGEEVVREMNRLGMMVDVSHVSDDTFWDVLRVSEAPVIASHSACRALADHPRNLSDDMLRALAARGGVAMLNFYPVYLDERARDAARELYAQHGEELRAIHEGHKDDPGARRRAFEAFFRAHPEPDTSLDVLLDHFDHAIRVAGPRHVGLGSDWDGVPSLPRVERDGKAVPLTPEHLPELTRGLLRRGHAPETVLAVLGGNLLRVMEEVERAGFRLRREAAGD